MRVIINFVRTTIVAASTSCVDVASSLVSRMREKCTHRRNSVFSKNVHRVALNLIELVNPRQCARARATKRRRRHRRSYVQNPSCNKVLWFQSGRAANAAFIPAAVVPAAAVLTVRESGRWTTWRRRASSRMRYSLSSCVPSMYAYSSMCTGLYVYFITVLSRQLKFCE